MSDNASSSAAGSKSKGGRLKKILLYVLGALAVIFVGIQFVPVEAMENKPVVADHDGDQEVEAILRRACYDCHSYETKWPWYSRIAPASWLVAKDVIEGRKAFNFSEWPEDEDDRQFNRESAWEIVEEGEMPPWFYMPMHPEAALSEADLAKLKAWAAEKEEEEEEEEKEPAEKQAAAGKADAGAQPNGDKPKGDKPATTQEGSKKDD